MVRKTYAHHGGNPSRSDSITPDHHVARPEHLFAIDVTSASFSLRSGEFQHFTDVPISHISHLQYAVHVSVLTHKGGFLYIASHLKQVLITDHAQRSAVRFGLRYEEKGCSRSLMRKMIYGPWDKEFILARPGETITLDQFLAGPS
jgi:hypothetical protein